MRSPRRQVAAENGRVARSPPFQLHGPGSGPTQQNLRPGRTQFGASNHETHERHERQEPTNRLLADHFAEETFALAALGTLWSIESEPEGKLQAGPPLVFV